MKYFLIAGEASGDLHGAGLVRALHQEDPAADCRGWGGERMESAGMQIKKHYRELAFMGFWEVAKNILTIRKNFKICKQQLLEFQPDAVILIDYPGFNLRLAKWLHQQGFRIYYYISPQLWAWNPGRVRTIKETVRRMFVILPFEKAFYQTYDVAVDFVGHPLLDVIPGWPAVVDDFRINTNPVVALLPGSRRQEIHRMLEIMLPVARSMTDRQFIIAAAPSIPTSYYRTAIIDILKSQPAHIKVLENRTYDLLQVADAALVTSGTATLETALFEVPQVVCYRANGLSYRIAKRLIRVPYISLVNLIADQAVVTELIQQDLNDDRLARELDALFEPAKRTAILGGYKKVRDQLGEAGAGGHVAKLIFQDLKKEIKKTR